MTQQDDLTPRIRSAARDAGFPICGIAPAVEPAGYSRFAAWLDAGFAGQMDYLPRRRDAYAHPRSILEGVRSIVMLAMPYRTVEAASPRPGAGRVSCYAWGETDYHAVVRDRLEPIADLIRTARPAAAVRGVVDTAPLLEREFAQLAGLGWIGKNTLLIHREWGSWIFLAALLTDVELAVDAPFEADHCGTCRACLDACPTDAFPEPYVLDSRRCISYLTIERKGFGGVPPETGSAAAENSTHRHDVSSRSGPAPDPLLPAVSDWLFGCDICQEVCPWNRRAPTDADPQFQPIEGSNPVDVVSLFFLDDNQFRDRFRRTPLWRSRRRGILRNAAVILGNRPVQEAAAALARGLSDSEPIVRAASAWALGRYARETSAPLLRARLSVEPAEEVIRELEASLTPPRPPNGSVMSVVPAPAARNRPS